MYNVIMKPQDMTFDQHAAWMKTLSDAELTKLERKTFKTTEYVVSILDENGDIDDSNCYDTLAEADRAFADTGAEVAAVLEKRVSTRKVLDPACKVAEDNTTIKTRGDAIGWI